MAGLAQRRFGALQQDGLVRKIAQNGVLRGGGLLLGLLVEAGLVRVLAPADYAQWGQVLAFSVIAIVLVQWGYQTSAMILFARSETDGPTLAERLCAALLLWSGAALFGAGMLALTFGVLFPGLTGSGATLAAICVFTFARALNTALAEGLRGLDQTGAAAGLTGLGQHGGPLRVLMLGLALLVLQSLDALTLISALWASTLASALSALLALAQMRPFLSGPGVRAVRVWRALRDDFALNTRLCLSQLLLLGSSRFAAILIGGALGLGAGLVPLLLALQLAQLIAAPLTIINGAIPARLTACKGAGQQQSLAALLRSCASLGFASSLLLAGGFALGGPALFHFGFGSAGAQAYPIFLLLLPGFLANSFAGPAGRALSLLGQEQAFLRVAAISAVFALPLYVLAGQIWGTPGLAAAISLVMGGQNLMLVLAQRRRLGVWGYAFAPVMVALK